MQDAVRVLEVLKRYSSRRGKTHLIRNAAIRAADEVIIDWALFLSAHIDGLSYRGALELLAMIGLVILANEKQADD